MKLRTSHINILLIILFGLIVIGLLSCSTAKHIGSETENITVRDTAIFDSTIITNNYFTDTLLDINSIQDTVFITQEKLKIKTVIKDKKIYISGECEEDTVYIHKEIPVETTVEVIKEVYRYPTWWESNRVWLIPLIILAVIGVIAKKLKII